MRLRFRWKLGALFILLLFLFILIQAYLLYSLKKSFLFSSLVGVLITLPLVYLILKSVTQPIQAVTDLANRVASGNLDQGIPAESDDELGRLSKAINEMSLQLQNKIEEISREKDYLQTLLRGIMEGVLVVDARGRILMVNNALRQLLSLPPHVEDRTPLEIIRNAELERTLRQVLQDGESTTLELTLPSPEGKTFQVNVVCISPTPEGMVKEDEGRRGVIAVFHDITRLKELEKIRRDFVANVSHELRTPLTTIKGYAETLLEGALKEEVASQFVQVIKRHSDRLEKIVEDLLILSKIESKEFHLKIESLSVSDLIADVLDFLRELLNKKKISVSAAGISPTLLVYGDRQYLEQVFINILDNAIKYGREGGTITILATERNQREVEISVKDDGIGIPKEDLLRVFERFYRVDKGRSHELGGTGLGLSIVKHIVQAHGGKVWAESQLEEGSTFYFTLPLHPSPLKGEGGLPAGRQGVRGS
jgi:two-component system phosphate regulon sensor histidine kinase PhoR